MNNLKLFFIIDNRSYIPKYIASWGLSILIKINSKGILFDVGGDYIAWRHNFNRFGLKKNDIDIIFISHWHGDHCGALPNVLRYLNISDIPIYVPSYSSMIREISNLGGKPVICSKPTRIDENIYSTGNMGRLISEHALAINIVDKGLVVFVGCSHPGVLNLVKKSMEIFNTDKVYGVLGGFHLSGYNNGLEVAKRFREMGLKYIAPTHCTGDDFRNAVKVIFGQNFLNTGSGFTITL